MRALALLLAAAAALPPPHPSDCVIELECAECVPENMPLVTSPEGVWEGEGALRVRGGGAVALRCAGGKFTLYPLRAALAGACEGGRIRVAHDGSLRHLLELGCQENVYEDVLHEVPWCAPPLQGRAYLTQEGGGARHLAALCYDAGRALATRASCVPPAAAPPLPAHAHAAAPLSLLGNFHHMFDASTRRQAERLYAGGGDALTAAARQLLRHDAFPLAAQTLTAAPLLAPAYFGQEHARVAHFASNRFPCWRSVAEGNLRHVQRDVARLTARAPGRLHVHAGTHGTMSVRAGADGGTLYLRPPGRFPVPRYVWTVLHDPRNHTAVALVVLNDPYVAVGEAPGAVFCATLCDRVPWLHDLLTNRNYDVPMYGLAFCCPVHEFVQVVTEMPQEIVKNVPKGSAGLLIDV